MEKLIFTFPSPKGAVLSVTNTEKKSIVANVDVYFENMPPVTSLSLSFPAERVTALFLDKPFADEKYKIPDCRFSIVLKSTEPLNVTI